jgi:hypothetical protein
MGPDQTAGLLSASGSTRIPIVTATPCATRRTPGERPRTSSIQETTAKRPVPIAMLMTLDATKPAE